MRGNFKMKINWKAVMDNLTLLLTWIQKRWGKLLTLTLELGNGLDVEGLSINSWKKDHIGCTQYCKTRWGYLSLQVILMALFLVMEQGCGLRTLGGRKLNKKDHGS